jgi:hypothetical protein
VCVCVCVCVGVQVFAERYVILLPRDQQADVLAAAESRPRGSHSGLAGDESSPGAVGAVKTLIDTFKLSPDQYQVR